MGVGAEAAGAPGRPCLPGAGDAQRLAPAGASRSRSPFRLARPPHQKVRGPAGWRQRARDEGRQQGGSQGGQQQGGRTFHPWRASRPVACALRPAPCAPSPATQPGSARGPGAGKLGWWRRGPVCARVSGGARVSLALEEKEREKAKAYSTRYSQAVSHPSTNQARPCLASEIRRDRARSGWYGRRRSQPLHAAPRPRGAAVSASPSARPDAASPPLCPFRPTHHRAPGGPGLGV